MKAKKLKRLVKRYRDALDARPVPIAIPGYAHKWSTGENPQKLLAKILAGVGHK